MYEEWKKSLEEFQKSGPVFQKELVELQKELPKKSEMIESMSLQVSLTMKLHKNIVEQIVEHVKEFKFSENYKNLQIKLNTEEQIQILYLYDLQRKLLQSKGEFYEMNTVFNKEINRP